MENMNILYDSKNGAFKTPFGALRQDKECTISIKIPRHFAVLNVFIIIERDGILYNKTAMHWEEICSGYDVYRITFSLEKTGLYFYYFEIVDKDNTYNISKKDGQIIKGLFEKWQLTCFDKSYTPPKGFEGGVMYQIFPDRFYFEKLCSTEGKLKPFFIHKNTDECPVFLPDENGIIQNNDFFGGNLAGVTKKLPYLKDLGVSILYLNPVFMAYSNHRYDTADYLRIDPLLGNQDDFKQLCDSAHKEGIKIILDGVFSHTGSNSRYFDKEKVFGNGAYKNPSSPYYEWYDFSSPEKYTSWWGINTLPCVNENVPSYRDFIIENEDSVIAHWLNMGADGFRLDVADELPDSFIMALSKRVRSLKPDAIIIGEVWEDASNKISYGKRRTYFCSKDGVELDSVMNYPFRNAILDVLLNKITPPEFARTVMSIAENYPRPVFFNLMNSLSTHDTERILTLLSDVHPSSREERASFLLTGDELSMALKKEEAAVFLQFLLPGIPCIYYGDEAGCQGFEDPFNRRFFPWGKENENLINFYKDMANLRKLIPYDADISFFEHDSSIIFKRDSFIVVCNTQNLPCSIEFDSVTPCYFKNAKLAQNTLFLKPYGIALLKIKI